MKSLMDVYIEVNTKSEEEVKKDFGVAKKSTLKVLKKLILDELKNGEDGSPAEKKTRKPRKKRTNKPGKEKGPV